MWESGDFKKCSSECSWATGSSILLVIQMTAEGRWDLHWVSWVGAIVAGALNGILYWAFPLVSRRKYDADVLICAILSRWYHIDPSHINNCSLTITNDVTCDRSV